MNILKTIGAGHKKVAEIAEEKGAPINLDVLDVGVDVAIGVVAWGFGYPFVGLAIIVVLEIVKWAMLYNLGMEE